MRNKIWFSLAVAGLLLPGIILLADDPKSDVKVTPTTKATADTKKGDSVDDPKGHLPPYYKYVVSAEQRDKIYAIEENYSPKIKELRKQLTELDGKRAAEVKALLSAEQQKKLDAIVADAKAKRATAASAATDSGDPNLPKPVAKLPLSKTPGVVLPPNKKSDTPVKPDPTSTDKK